MYGEELISCFNIIISMLFFSISGFISFKPKIPQERGVENEPSPEQIESAMFKTGLKKFLVEFVRVV